MTVDLGFEVVPFILGGGKGLESLRRHRLRVSIQTKWKGRMTCISVELPKSERERYIHVVAIEVVISEGYKNICVAGSHQEPPPLHRSLGIQRHTKLNASVFGRQSTFSIVG